MLRFLFWNLNRKPIEALVQRIVEHHEIDVVILAETSDPDAVNRSLNSRKRPRPYHRFAPVKSSGVQLLARFDPSLVTPLLDSPPRITACHFRLPARMPLLIAGVHFPSKLHLQDLEQAALSADLARDLVRLERRVGHQHTLVAGDFNMNPFEFGLVGAPGGLNATMDRSVARKSRRHPFFYNPMWNRLGDWGPGPTGTYYYDSSSPLNYFWNTFDQVLVRPDLIDRFVEADLRVLNDAGPRASLLTKSGVPDQEAASDHLPLLFSLDV